MSSFTSEPPALKKARVAEPDDSGEDLKSSDDESSEEDGDDGDEEPFRGNDMIDLVFMEPDDADDLLAEPQFTHQVFDEEEHLEEVRFMEAPENCRVTINIRCSDYKHLVGIPAGSSTEEQDKLIECIKKALPDDAEIHRLHGNNNGDDEDEENDATYLDRIDTFAAERDDNTCSTAPGKLLYTFKRGKDSYEIYLASGADSGVADIIKRAEALAMWYIETADSVDFAGDSRWQALLLYRRCDTCRDSTGRVVHKKVLSLAGYYTLFTFHNPFAGSKLRVCQALILPHLQGKGLGRELLLCTYRLVHDPSQGLVEVTVEDPAPGFQSLRDACDIEWLHTQTSSYDISSNDSNEIEALAHKLRITIGQAVYLREVSQYATLKDKYHQIDNNDNSDGVQSISLEAENQWKAFRLTIKRRFLKEKPEIKNLTKPKMQEELEALYNEQRERYERGYKTRQRLINRENSGTN